MREIWSVILKTLRGGLEFNAQHKVSPWGGLGGGQNGNALERRCWEALEAPGDVPAVT